MIDSLSRLAGVNHYFDDIDLIRRTICADPARSGESSVAFRQALADKLHDVLSEDEMDWMHRSYDAVGLERALGMGETRSSLASISAVDIAAIVTAEGDVVYFELSGAIDEYQRWSGVQHLGSHFLGHSSLTIKISLFDHTQFSATAGVYSMYEDIISGNKSPDRFVKLDRLPLFGRDVQIGFGGEDSQTFSTKYPAAVDVLKSVGITLPTCMTLVLSNLRAASTTTDNIGGTLGEICRLRQTVFNTLIIGADTVFHGLLQIINLYIIAYDRDTIPALESLRSMEVNRVVIYTISTTKKLPNNVHLLARNVGVGRADRQTTISFNSTSVSNISIDNDETSYDQLNKEIALLATNTPNTRLRMLRLAKLIREFNRRFD